MISRAARATLAVLVAGLVLTGCNRDSGKAVGRLEPDGRAEVTQVDGRVRQVTDGRTLRDGEQVKIVDGRATLSLGEGRRLELRKDSVVRLALEELPNGEATPRAQVVGGDVLVVTSEQPATVVAGDTEVDVTGVARVSTGLTVTVATYEGAAGVRTGGRAASVPALRQVSVPAPGLPSRPAPLLFDAADPWDQRYLGDAIDLGNQLSSRSLGFTAQLRPGQGTAAFFSQILPELASQPVEALLDPAMAPGETLVGAAITLAGDRAQFADRWRNVFTFHQEGAPWGLVALDQGVDRGAVLAAVDAAIARVPGLTPSPTPSAPAGPGGSTGGGGQLAAPGPGPTGTTVPTPSVGGSGSGGSTAGTTATTTPPSGGGATGGTGTQPAPLPDRGPVNLGLPVVDDTLNAVIDALSGLLGAIGEP